jgi:hypothetical protein
MQVNPNFRELRTDRQINRLDDLLPALKRLRRPATAPSDARKVQVWPLSAFRAPVTFAT